MKRYNGVGLLMAAAGLALAGGAHGAPAVSSEPGRPNLSFLKFT
jgi:hypothetical protein